MRARLLTVAAIGLVFCVGATAQGVTQAGDHVNFTFTDFETRVPVHLPLSTATGTVGADFLCHEMASGIASASGGPSRSRASASVRDPGDLKDALFQTVYAKTAPELGKLLSNVQSAPDRAAKARQLFGIENLAQTPAPYAYALDPSQMRLLQMGQAVTPSLVSMSASLDSVPAANQRCYTAQQVDQAIAEGTRVVAAIIQALQPAKPLAQPQIPEERGAPKK